MKNKNFEFEGPKPSVFAGSFDKNLCQGLKSISRKGDFCKNEWARKWVDLLEMDQDPQILRKGRMIARKGNIRGIKTDFENITAHISDNGADIITSIPLIRLRPDEKFKIINELTESSHYAIQVLKGRLPKIKGSLKTIFNDILLPFKNGFKGTCSCRDWSNPCRHIMGLSYLLTEAYDECQLFPLHVCGISTDMIFSAFGAKRGFKADIGKKTKSRKPAPFIPSLALFKKGLPNEERKVFADLKQELKRIISKNPANDHDNASDNAHDDDTELLNKLAQSELKNHGPAKIESFLFWEGSDQGNEWFEKVYKSCSEDVKRLIEKSLKQEFSGF
jgi:uncharacterized Zn finger protein